MLDTVDWGCPDALQRVMRSAVFTGATGCVLLSCGAGERALDALLVEGYDRVVVAAPTNNERAMLALRVAAITTLPADMVWSMLGCGDMGVRAAALLPVMFSSPNPCSSSTLAYWRRRAHVLSNLYRNGRSGWLMWSADVAIRVLGLTRERVFATGGWHDTRWRVNAALMTAFATFSPGCVFGWGRGRLIGESWHRYVMGRLEAAFGQSNDASVVGVQWALVRSGRYDEDRPPPYLRDSELVSSRLCALSVHAKSMRDELLTCLPGSYNVVVLGGCLEDGCPSWGYQMARMAARALASAPNSAVLAWSVLEDPKNMHAQMIAAGLTRAHKMVNLPPGMFVSYWTYARE